jgi:hypothetical protein
MFFASKDGQVYQFWLDEWGDWNGAVYDRHDGMCLGWGRAEFYVMEKGWSGWYKKTADVSGGRLPAF